MRDAGWGSIACCRSRMQDTRYPASWILDRREAPPPCILDLASAMRSIALSLFSTSRIKKEKGMTYKDLDIWKLARGLVVDINSMTLKDLPRFEMYETGSQIRRSSVSIKANIVEGFGRRRYKLDFIHFLVFAHSSADETIDHLETLFETGALKSKEKYEDLHARLELLGRRLNAFIQAVCRGHRS